VTFSRFMRLISIASFAAAPALAQTIETQSAETLATNSEEEIVRLPGQGEVKPEAAGRAGNAGRLIAGGGLILSFDSNSDGTVTPAELETGIRAAFETADRNSDGRMTPLEQMAWAERLPTRDTSLANPARFDPNLDRVVREAEFSEVVQTFAASLADETTGEVNLAKLQSRNIGRRAIEEPVAPRRRQADAERATGAVDTPRTSRQNDRRTTTGRGS